MLYLLLCEILTSVKFELTLQVTCVLQILYVI